jgi:hypothetical protein
MDPLRADRESAIGNATALVTGPYWLQMCTSCYGCSLLTSDHVPRRCSRCATPTVSPTTPLPCGSASALAPGESVIKCPSPLNVLKDTYDRCCHCRVRSDEYQHLLMTDSPAASHGRLPSSAWLHPAARVAVDGGTIRTPLNIYSIVIFHTKRIDLTCRDQWDQRYATYHASIWQPILPIRNDTVKARMIL